MCRKHTHRTAVRLAQIIHPKRRATSPGSRARPQSGSHDPEGMFRFDGCLNKLALWHQKYLDGVLDDEQMTAVDDHLFECLRCANHWEALSSEFEESLVVRIAPELADSNQLVAYGYAAPDYDRFLPRNAKPLRDAGVKADRSFSNSRKKRARNLSGASAQSKAVAA